MLTFYGGVTFYTKSKVTLKYFALYFSIVLEKLGNINI